MKTYNALSKSFTDEVKTKMGGGKSIDVAVEDVKIMQLANGHEYVDLGLPSGTMWATCNVGADKPEDSGLLFQFGRVDGYKYGDENHKFRTFEQNTQDTGDEYIPVTTSGKVYKANDILDLDDDAAHVNMGGIWKMPTKDELQELIDNTTHKVETINGINGVLFTSKNNGHQLFIPICGYWSEDDNFLNENDINVWSSQVYPSDVSDAYTLYCYSSGNAIIYYDHRSYAYSVRGVFKK